MDDVQNEQPKDIENDVNISESATEEQEVSTEAQEVEQGKITFSDEQQEILNKEIGKKTAKIYEERQAREAAEQQLQELQARLQPNQEEITIPEMPDVNLYYDDEQTYLNKLSEREAAIQKKAEFDAQTSYIEQQQAQQLRQQQITKQREIV